MRPPLRRVAFLLLLAACGSRTGLFADEGLGADLDGGNARFDASVEAGEDVPDALPPLDVRPPLDANRNDCPDAEATLVYTITSDFELQSFNPATGAFRLISNIACPSEGATPFSMAVDRKGIAYILFTDERLYRVSTATGACIATTYRPRQANFGRFGMGFATNSIGPTETLYVAGTNLADPNLPASAEGLAAITPGTFLLSPVAGFNPVIRQAELTGTGDGRLYAFYKRDDVDDASNIGEIDPQTARLLGERHFANVDQGNAWAFAFWGGDFYMFHAPANRTLVTRWRPSDDSVTQVASTDVRIVGAGVSTCAPQQ